MKLFYHSFPSTGSGRTVREKINVFNPVRVELVETYERNKLFYEVK
ncbi:MAG TPA: hypothetical protein VHX42_04310 [Candidatus Babeliales bacterium]|jgi:hypothetical protein|nr:hypothetical protein [Candidatus Babeliales bacterium]